MNYSKRRLDAALAMPDCDEKLGKLESIGLSIGIFDKQLVIDECHRLRALGFESPALKYIRTITKA